MRVVDDAGTEDDLPEMEAVMKVFCTHVEPNFGMPWQKRRQFSSTSSGFLIAGRRVLTNAHSVEFGESISLTRRGDDTKYPARLLALGVECDIAVLTVDDPAFWADAPPPLQFGSLPRQGEGVLVVGYPVGGDTLSVTSGVVSRIEVTHYSLGMTELLGMQIDAAINAGNSGGPVLNEAGECVGIAFQSRRGDEEASEGVGYAIPTPVIARLLADVARCGTFQGFPSLGIEWQPLESPALRAASGMAERHKGILISRVLPTSPSAAVLRRGDVLLAFDGARVGNDGSVPFRAGERIAFSHLVAQRFVGDTATLALLRGGQELEVAVPLAVPHLLIPPFHSGAAPPPYLIVAGLVFVACSDPYLKAEFGDTYEWDAPVPLLNLLLSGLAKAPGDQVVVLSQVLTAEVNRGYEDLTNNQVLRFNGGEVRSLAGLAAAVAASTEPFLSFELDSGDVVVLDAAAARAATPAILATHEIPAAASAGLLTPL